MHFLSALIDLVTIQTKNVFFFNRTEIIVFSRFVVVVDNFPIVICYAF